MSNTLRQFIILLFLIPIPISGQKKINANQLKIDYFKELCYNDDQLFSGITYSKYENGELEFEKRYKNGQLNGLTKIYYENGQLNIREKIKSGKLIKCKYWYESGKLKGKSGYFKEKEFIKHWHENGKRKAILKWKKRKIVRTSKAWDENGILAKKIIVNEKTGNGIFMLWHGNGKLKTEINIVNGKVTNEKCWDENGNEVTCDEETTIKAFFNK